MNTNDLRMRKCLRFEGCNAPLCPLDEDMNLRSRLKGEIRCPFTMESRTKNEKRIRTTLPKSLINFIPKKNLKTLNSRSLKMGSK